MFIFKENLLHKTFNQTPNAMSFSNYLTQNFPNPFYNSVFEVGFNGLNAHYELTNLSIRNIMINPTYVPTSNNERRRKTDKVDGNKFACKMERIINYKL